MQGTPAWLIVREVRAFFFNLYCTMKACFTLSHHQQIYLLNRMIGFHQCPGQYNDIDCGLFCIAVVLNLLNDKPVTEGTFNFNHFILL